MGCLLELLSRLFDSVIMDFFLPWFAPDPDAERNVVIYGYSSLLTGLVAAGCWFATALYPELSTLLVIRWVALILCAYFAFIMFTFTPHQ